MAFEALWYLLVRHSKRESEAARHAQPGESYLLWVAVRTVWTCGAESGLGLTVVLEGIEKVQDEWEGYLRG